MQHTLFKPLFSPLQTVCLLLATTLTSVFAQDTTPPADVTALYAENITHTSFRVRWEPPTPSNDVDHYAIHMSHQESGQEWYSTQTDLSKEFAQLPPGRYDCTVMALDASGNRSMGNASLKLRIGPVDSTEMRTYIFGHSLVHHTLGPDPHTSNIPFWLSQLATAGGKKWAVDGQFGQPPYHTIPGTPQWKFDGVPSAWNNSFGESSYTNIIITHANFVQNSPATAPYGGFTPMESTFRLLDNARSHYPNIPFIIYENWPKLPQFPATQDEMEEYHTNARGDFHTWWLDLQDMIQQERPDASVQMFPVGPIISGLFQTIPALNSIPLTDLYEDVAPHGRPALYFLAALVHYSSLFKEPIPLNYSIPNTLPLQISENIHAIRDYIWDELNAFTFPNGDSRVWTVPPLLSSESSESSVSSVSSSPESSSHSSQQHVSSITESSTHQQSSHEQIHTSSDSQSSSSMFVSFSGVSNGNNSIESSQESTHYPHSSQSNREELVSSVHTVPEHLSSDTSIAPLLNTMITHRTMRTGRLIHSAATNISVPESVKSFNIYTLSGSRIYSGTISKDERKNIHIPKGIKEGLYFLQYE
ncbi:MAG: fibronectin type III domain-containing protein [Fibrobacterales bacterium]